MSTMQRSPPSSRVRRRLFSEDEVTHQAKLDNFANCITERIFYDKDASSKKWNFDFENEVPLEGTYEWVRCDNPEQWIGKARDQQPITDVTAEDDEEDMAQDTDKLISIRDENEDTPKQKEEDEACIPLARKRRQEIENTADKGARRKISFD